MTTDSPSIRLRRSNDRGFSDFGWTDNWMTFSFAEYRDPEWVHFGPLRVIVENHIQPHSGFQAHPHRHVEIVTYVSSGILTHKDSFGHSGGIASGEMQHISAGSNGMIHSEENIHDEVEHNYQMWFIPSTDQTEFGYQQLKFTPDERKGRFRTYVSPDQRDSSMPINTDARVYSGLFSKGDAVTHSLEKGRGAWVQVVNGKLEVAGVTLTQGDGAGITDTDTLEFTFYDDSEVLLFDVRMDVPLIWK